MYVVDRVLHPPGGASSISLGGSGDTTESNVTVTTMSLTLKTELGTDPGPGIDSSQPQPAGVRSGDSVTLKTELGAGTDTGTDTGADTDADTDADTGTDTGAGSGISQPHASGEYSDNTTAADNAVTASQRQAGYSFKLTCEFVCMADNLSVVGDIEPLPFILPSVSVIENLEQSNVSVCIGLEGPTSQSRVSL